MFPLFKPYNRKVSFWYIALRVAEGVLMVIAGILFLSSNTLLLDIRDSIYVWHAYIFAVAALYFYYLLYISKLVPRWLSAWGFIASILLIIVNVFEGIGLISQNMILYLPIISNELILAIWLMVKGFNLSDTRKS